MTPEELKAIYEASKIQLEPMHGHIRLAFYVKKIIAEVAKGTNRLTKENAEDGKVFLGIFKKEQEEANKIEWKFMLQPPNVQPTPPTAPPTTQGTNNTQGTEDEEPTEGVLNITVSDKAGEMYTQPVKITLVAISEPGKLDWHRTIQFTDQSAARVFPHIPLDRQYALIVESEKGVRAEVDPEIIKFTTTPHELATAQFTDELKIELLTHATDKTTVEFASRDTFAFRLRGTSTKVAWVCTVTDPDGQEKTLRGTKRVGQVPLAYDKLGNYVIKLEVTDEQKKESVQREVQCHAGRPHEYTLRLKSAESFTFARSLKLQIDGIEREFKDGAYKDMFQPGKHVLHDPNNMFLDKEFSLGNNALSIIEVQKRRAPLLVEVKDFVTERGIENFDVQLDVYTYEVGGPRPHALQSGKTNENGIIVFDQAPVGTPGIVRFNAMRRDTRYEAEALDIITAETKITHVMTKVTDAPTRKDVDVFIDGMDKSFAGRPRTAMDLLPFEDFMSQVHMFITSHYTQKNMNPARLTREFKEEALAKVGYGELELYARWSRMRITRRDDMEYFITEWLKKNPKGTEAQVLAAFATSDPQYTRKHRFTFTWDPEPEDIQDLKTIYAEVKAKMP